MPFRLNTFLNMAVKSKDITVPYEESEQTIPIVSELNKRTGALVIPFFFDATGKVDTDGIIKSNTVLSTNDGIKVSFNKNNTMNDKTAKLRMVQNKSGKKLDLNILQLANGSVLIPDSDYVVFRYYWTDNDGYDLDTATCFVGTNLPLDENNKIDGLYVGYHGGTNNGSLTYILNKYIKHGGDNRRSGAESVCICFKDLLMEDNRRILSEAGVTTIDIDVYANWYGSGNSYTDDDGVVHPIGWQQNAQIEFTAYKGGEIVGPTNYIFSNPTAEKSVTYPKVDVHVDAHAANNVKFPLFLYTKLGTLTYNIESNSASFKQTENHDPVYVSSDYVYINIKPDNYDVDAESPNNDKLIPSYGVSIIQADEPLDRMCWEYDSYYRPGYFNVNKNFFPFDGSTRVKKLYATCKFVDTERTDTECGFTFDATYTNNVVVESCQNATYTVSGTHVYFKNMTVDFKAVIRFSYTSNGVTYNNNRFYLDAK